MVARLPTPGSDKGAWGDLLNEYLQVAHSSTGALAANVIGTTQIQDNSVTTAKITDASVTNLKIAAVDAAKITSGTLDVARIPSLSSTYVRVDGTDYITTAKIQDGIVTKAKLSTGVQSSLNNADAAAAGALVDGSVTTAKIADAAVTNVKIASVDAAKMTSGTLDVARIPSLSTTYARVDGATYTGMHDFTSSTVLGLPTGPQGAPGLVWRGVYNGATTYATNDTVQFNGSSFTATAGTIGVAPGTTSAPNAPWQLLAGGSTGGGASGSAGEVSPADLAFKAWACDPIILNPGTRTALVAGQMNGVLLSLPSDTITGISFYNGVAGTVLTNCYAALIDAATGNRLAVTADISTNLQSTGLKRIAFVTPFLATSGPVYAVFLVGSGTVMPQLTKFTNTDTGFVNARGPNSPTGRIRVGQITVASGLTAIPATNDMSGSSAQNTGMWVGID